MNRRGFLGSVAGALVGGTFQRLAPAQLPPAPAYFIGCDFAYSGGSSTGVLLMEASRDGKNWYTVESFHAAAQEEMDAALHRMRAKLAADFVRTG